MQIERSGELGGNLCLFVFRFFVSCIVSVGRVCLEMLRKVKSH